jgi:hypothetical protein
MSDPNQRFFLQAIDLQYGCPVIEAMFIVSDLSVLRGLLGSRADGDPDLRATYWLEKGDLTAINERFGATLESGGREVTLNRWHSIRAVPYLVHTNYELFLLVDGTKKFARMSAGYPPLQHGDEDLFDVHVAKGVLYKEIELRAFPKPLTTRDGRIQEGVRYVYYAPTGEKWRIEAWKLLFAASQKAGWNETCECFEGMLFGYEEWQIDWWIKRRKKRP